MLLLVLLLYIYAQWLLYINAQWLLLLLFPCPCLRCCCASDL